MVGVIDCTNLPDTLNKEMLDIIKNIIVEKSIELFTEIMKNENNYKILSNSIKIAIRAEEDNRNSLASLIKYESTKSNGEYITFDTYISRCKTDDNEILYISGDTDIKESPFLDIYNKDDKEVLFLPDPIDEYYIDSLKTYKDKNIICITKLQISEDNDEGEYKVLCDIMQSHLNIKISTITMSKRLVDFPAVISTHTNGWSSYMGKVMKMQIFNDSDTNKYFFGKKILELNPNHKIIIHLQSISNNIKMLPIIQQITDMLYQTALLVSGFDIESPIQFSKKNTFYSRRIITLVLYYTFFYIL